MYIKKKSALESEEKNIEPRKYEKKILNPESVGKLFSPSCS